MTSLYLIGGGWNPEGFSATYGRFIQAATVNQHRNIILVLEAGGSEALGDALAAYYDVFKAMGVSANEIVPFFISENVVLDERFVKETQPTGIFVCGGLTPLYQSCLCTDATWLGYVLTHNIPYGGFSAGAAIAARNAIVGGWKIACNGRQIPILDPDLAEELDYLTVRDGLGLVEFSIDVHGSQWGTLTRLIHAVDQGMIANGWVIDEDTMLEIKDGAINVFGLGQAYYITGQGGGKVQVTVYREGGVIF